MNDTSILIRPSAKRICHHLNHFPASKHSIFEPDIFYIELDVNSHSVDIFFLFSMKLSLRKYILRREEYIPQNYRLRPKVPGLENILIVALVKIVTGGSVRNSCVVSKSSSQTLS